MLYWAEGSKGPHCVEFTNSDPEVARLFVTFLNAYFDVGNRKVRVWCNLFADHMVRQREIEGFWLQVLDLPSDCLRKSTVNRYSRCSKRKRTNALPYGTCRIIVHDTAILQHIYGAIQEYAGFERPEWLR